MPRFTPRADALETRLALSAVALTPASYEAARGRISLAAGQLVATGNAARADATLERAVRVIPGGGALLPTLEGEADSIRVGNRPSARAAVQAMTASLDDFIRDRVASGDIAVNNPALRKRLDLAPPPAPTPPPPAPPVPTPPPAPPAPTAPVPASLSVNVLNSTTSNVYVSFSQVVNGVRTQLTGVSVGAGVTARFVPIITQNSSPITVSYQSSTLGYWQVVAPANFNQLRLSFAAGRGQFSFG